MNFLRIYPSKIFREIGANESKTYNNYTPQQLATYSYYQAR